MYFTNACKTKQNMDAKCAVLMLVLDGDVGTLLLPESVRSFAAPAGVSGFFIADLSSPSKVLDLPAGAAVRVLRLPRAARDVAFQQLRLSALAAGFTHGMLAYSHEILKRQTDSQAVEALPGNWQSLDVLQTVSNVRHRRNVDLLVNLRRFTVLGPASPAPLPLMQEGLVAAAWQGVCVDACAHTVSRAAAMEIYLHTLARQEEYAKAPLLVDGFLRHQIALAALQAQLYREASGVLQRRVKQGATGWAEQEGQYWTLALKAECIDALKWPLDKCLPDMFAYANLGLTLGRMEGAVRLHACLMKHGAQTLTVYALATLASFPETLHEGCWMGNPGAYTHALRAALGAGLELLSPPENEAAAAEQLYCAARAPAARLDSALQAAYHPLAREGDNAPAIRWFPAPDDLLLPEVVKVAAFLDPARGADMVTAVRAAGGARAWTWLRILLSNAIRTPYCMQWGDHIHAGQQALNPASRCVHLVTAESAPWIFAGAVTTAAKGYACIISLNGCQVDADGDVVTLAPGGLLCLRAGVHWGIVPADATVLVAQLEFPHFS
jgi:hypothetical protein